MKKHFLSRTNFLNIISRFAVRALKCSVKYNGLWRINMNDIWHAFGGRWLAIIKSKEFQLRWYDNWQLFSKYKALRNFIHIHYFHYIFDNIPSRAFQTFSTLRLLLRARIMIKLINKYIFFWLFMFRLWIVT